MSKINQLTDEQKLFIDENRNKMPAKEIAEKLNTTKYRIWNYISKSNKEAMRTTEEGFFNVNEKYNWLIG